MACRVAFIYGALPVRNFKKNLLRPSNMEPAPCLENARVVWMLAGSAELFLAMYSWILLICAASL